MKRIAVAFAALLAIGVSMSTAGAAQNASSNAATVQSNEVRNAADEMSAGRRHWHGHRHWRGHRHWHGNRHWHGYRHWRGHRHCWNTWRHGRRIVVCR